MNDASSKAAPADRGGKPMAQRVAVLESQMEQMATRKNLSDLGAALRSEMAAIKAELKAEIASLRTELKAEIASLRTELKADIAGLNAKMNMLLWMLPVLAVIIVASIRL